jgi:type IV secretory pathway TrbD component
MKMPIYQSLVRYNLWLGMERLPLKMLGMANFIILIEFDVINSILAFNRYSFATFSILSSVNLFMMYCLRLMAKYDPRLIKSYFRSIRYQKYYTARSSAENKHRRNGMFIIDIIWKG